MSDPAHDGYVCHGSMVRVEIPGVYDGTCAYLCAQCGVWRHRFPASDTRRRALVKQAMPAIIDALLVGSKGDVA